MTRISVSQTSPASVSAQTLLVFAEPGPRSSVRIISAGLTSAAAKAIAAAVGQVGGTGSAGEVSQLPSLPRIKADRVTAVGVGDGKKQQDLEALRRAAGNAIRASFGSRKVAIAVPNDFTDAQFEAITWGARSAAYTFTEFKSGSKAKDAPAPPTSIVLVLEKVTAAQRAIVADVDITADGVDLARSLINTPPNALPPAALAAQAKEALRGLPVKVTVWDEKALKRDGCGGILAVGQGSANPPRLVKMEYRPPRAKGHYAYVGKGITFDTGGISIKPAANMDEMKGDMGGAAAVIGAVQAIARRKLPVRITAWIALAENMPSGTAQRPGDVITMYDGTTVEVLNTDAEGRLVLGDALGMAVLEKPDLIVDAATLTGAQRVALGSRIAGVMSNDDDARTRVTEVGERAGEALWPMPLPADLRASLDSPTADIANIGDRLGGMLTAGLFLQTFIPDGQPWVHVDIAGPSFNDKAAYGYTPKGGTGAMVRTFVRLAVECAAD
jgi:leucyl aminopeptidase